MLDAGEEFIAADGADTAGFLIPPAWENAIQETGGDFAAAVQGMAASGRAIHAGVASHANIPTTTLGELATWECRDNRDKWGLISRRSIHPGVTFTYSLNLPP